ncbi:MAG: hypothetical protein ACLUUF_05950 [Bifidobacterium pullorum]
MGVHTGDSITVAPAFTLTDQRIPDACAMHRHRDASAGVGVDTGGCNMQFAMHRAERPHGRRSR